MSETLLSKIKRKIIKVKNFALNIITESFCFLNLLNKHNFFYPRDLIKNKNDIDNNSIVFLKKLSQFYISSHNQKIKHLGLWDKIFNDSKHKQDNRYLGCESELLKYDHELLHKSLIGKNFVELKFLLDHFGSLPISQGLSTAIRVKAKNQELLEAYKTNNLFFSNNKAKPNNLCIKNNNNFGLQGIQVKKNRFIPLAGCRSFSNASKINCILNKYYNNILKKTVVEIGAGYGLVPYYLYSQLKFKGIYKIVDLPIISVLSAYFLYKSLKNIQIIFAHELKNKKYLDFKKKNQKRIFIIDPITYYKMNKKNINVTFNSDSFPELSLSSLKKYLKNISNGKNAYFFCVNHELEYKYADSRKIIHQHLNVDSVIRNNFRNVYSLVSKKKHLYKKPHYFESTYYIK